MQILYEAGGASGGDFRRGRFTKRRCREGLNEVIGPDRPKASAQGPAPDVLPLSDGD